MTRQVHFVGQPVVLWPIRFTAANPTLRIQPDSTGAGTEETVTLTIAANRNYWVSGDGDSRVGQQDILRVLEEALNSNAQGKVFRVTLSVDNIVAIDSLDDEAFSILWNNSLTTVDPGIFGFEWDQIDQEPMVSPLQTKGVWIPGADGDLKIYSEDLRNESDARGSVQVAMDGSSRGYRVNSDRRTRRLEFSLLERNKILIESAVSAEPYGTLEYAWENGDLVQGRFFRLYDNKNRRTAGNYEMYRTERNQRPWRELGPTGLNRYDATLDAIQVSRETGEVQTRWSTKFDGGANEYVEAADDASLEATTALTVSAWLRLDALQTWGATFAVLGRWAASQHVFRWVLTTTGRMQFQFANALTDPGSNHATTPNNTFVTGTWYHVVVIYNAGAVDCHVNGFRYSDTFTGQANEMVIGGVIPASLQSGSTSPIQIGADGAATGEFPGNIAHVSYFTAALSQADVDTLRPGGVPGDPTGITGYVSWWKMGDSDARAADSSDPTKDVDLIVSDEAGTNAAVYQGAGTTVPFVKEVSFI